MQKTINLSDTNQMDNYNIVAGIFSKSQKLLNQTHQGFISITLQDGASQFSYHLRYI